MSDDPSTDTDPEEDEAGLSKLQTLWRQSWSALLKGLLISIAFHLLVALVIWFQPSLPGDFELEWEGRMAELSDIGHGVEDFDDSRDVDWDDMADFEDRVDEQDTDDEPEGDDVEEPDEQDDPPEQADEQPEDDPEDSEEPDSETSIAEAEERQEPGPDPDGEDDDDSAEEYSESSVHPEESTGVPGIERSGPSNLPDLRDYAPGNARVTALVRTDRLRDTHLEPHVDDIVRAIPDYRIALDGTNFDPVADLDSLFMATADPTMLQETFVAARHRFDDDELRSTLDTRFDQSPPWEDNEGRPIRRLVPSSAGYPEPRRLLLAEPGLALIGKPSWFEELIGPVDENSDLGRRLAESETGPSVFSLIDGLTNIEEAVEDNDTFLLVTAYGGRLRSLPGVDVGGLPSFEGVRLALSNPQDPKLTIDLRFSNDDQARQFHSQCSRLQDELTRPFSALAFLGMTRYIDRLECRLEGDYVVVGAQYTGTEIRELLERLPRFVETTQPPPVRNLPRGPDPEPTVRESDGETEDGDTIEEFLDGEPPQLEDDTEQAPDQDSAAPEHEADGTDGDDRD